jgi:putative FmdB family regulatory protein
MPIYEYECSSCGKRFEIFQKMSEKELTECRVCKGRLQKLISNCSFQLKGTGWYVTDYKKPVDSVGKNKSSDNGGKETTSSETKAETSAPASTETKKEAKTETKTETTST